MSAAWETMTREELARATRRFDRELVALESRPLTEAERVRFESARRKPGRPRRGEGVRVVSVSIERSLLARTDVEARRLGISRASLIERGLRRVLGR
jgi:hypothetical protein